MASFYSDALLHKQPLATHSTTVTWPKRPKIRLHRRGRRLPTVHLGTSSKPRRGFFLARFLRRIRVRWLRLQHSCTLKKLKKYYRSLIKDLIEANAAADYQQRVFMDTSFAVPVVGASFSTYHGGSVKYGSGPHPSSRNREHT
ncbi:uncharacterized protein [Spinacia oleracea]|uniref:Uncharacterized protein n=1 Tax=Spinacia oleracea TaxID=3562 RepID=A0ABM3R5L3_SPIOL|nr:uncharacterized protein LOC110804006 [Spinacia oleracea]